MAKLEISINLEKIRYLIPALSLIFLMMPFSSVWIFELSGYSLMLNVIQGEIPVLHFDVDSRLPGTSIAFLSYLHYLSRTLFVISPIVFFFVSILSFFGLFLGKNGGKIYDYLQYFHLIYFVVTLILGFLGMFNSDPLIEQTLFSFATYGFYLSGFVPAFTLLFHESEDPVKESDE